ncbi:hypothetical protein HMPREF1545_04226 [Oscillibacter sp. KLE 1728]|nr:hypothetical protein HMPREF1545_04226 [Oscillibacter sp. KLE 1728]ERK57101.1 hypothetical protein HMPREF1546_04019 [Oscillibacter sp. KLE 1745]
MFSFSPHFVEIFMNFGYLFYGFVKSRTNSAKFLLWFVTALFPLSPVISRRGSACAGPGKYGKDAPRPGPAALPAGLPLSPLPKVAAAAGRSTMKGDSTSPFMLPPRGRGD